MKKAPSRHISSVLFFVLFTLLLCGFCIAMTFINIGKNGVDDVNSDTSEGNTAPLRAVVIDAGHGGVDGGASSLDGIKEKDINLSVALILRDLYSSVGIPTVLTRDEDVLLYDKNADHVGKKKIMDLSNRLETARKTPDSLFISIHQNSFSDKKYNGLQVWYSPHSALSSEIAQGIQSAATVIQPSNHRKTKAADERLFILNNLETPAVLIECGFLSNDEEAAKLNTEEYQRRLAFTIFISTVGYLKNN